MIESNFSFPIEIFSFIFFSYRDDRDRNDEIQQLIARAENNARQYMTNFNITTTSPSTLVRIIPVSSPTKIS
jgi:hypothetical protein